MATSKRKPARFRSKFEEAVASDLRGKGAKFTYESTTFHYSVTHTYTPDFLVFKRRSSDFIVIETKGYFPAVDRRKLLAVKEQNPNYNIRLLFQRASVPIRKGSKTTYAKWADKHGFVWAEGRVPEEWLK